MNQTDPFTLLQAELYEPTYLHAGPNFKTQMFVLSGIMGIAFILQLATLLVRWKRGDFWLFKLTKTPHGTFIVPHGILGYTLIGAIFCMVVQGYLSAMRTYATPGSDLYNSQYWRILTWIPLNWGIWILTWATLVAPLISRPADHHSGFSLSHHPKAINIFFLVHPFVFCGAIIPLAVISNTSYNALFKDIQTLHGLLGEARGAMTLGTTPPDELLMATMQESILAQVPVVLKDFRNCYISWSPFLGFQLLAFAFAAVVHFKSLDNAMGHLRRKMNTGGMYEEDFKSISRAYQSLVATTALVGVVDLAFFSIDAVLIICAEKISQGGRLAEFVVLTFAYSYSIFGGTAIIVILIRSFNTPRPFNHTTSSKSMSGSKNFFGTRTTPVLTFAQTVTIQMEGNMVPYEIELRERGEKDRPFVGVGEDE